MTNIYEKSREKADKQKITPLKPKVMRGGLELKILLVIVTAVTTILTGFGVYEYVSSKKFMTQELNELGDAISARLSQNLVSPLWDLDSDMAFSTLKTEMKENIIHGIIVHEEGGEEVFAAMTRDENWAPVQTDKAIEGQFIKVATNVMREGKAIGTVQLLMTEKFMKQALTSSVYSIVIKTVAIDLTIVLVLAFFIRRFVMSPLGRIQAFASRVGAGDLTCTIDTGRYSDELLLLKDAMESMVCTLGEKISEVQERQEEAEEQTRRAKEAATLAEEARNQAETARSEGMTEAARTLESIVSRITESAHHISKKIEETHAGAQQQSGRAAETATAMEQMNATVLEVARNAGETASQAEEARQKAQEGEDIVRQAVASIELVKSKTDDLMINMTTLNEQAHDTGKILGVISDIADQTNLLALNAAIEAARAGEAGRGFAVVADEVRKLAEKTMDATKEVENSINGIRSGAESSAATTREADKVVKEATELANDSGKSLEEILTLVEGTSARIASIATAAEEQSATSDEIARSVGEINAITDETTRGMTHASQEVGDMKTLVTDLENLIDKLKR